MQHPATPLFLLSLALSLLAGCVDTPPTPYEVEDARLHDVGTQAAAEAMKGVDTSELKALK